MSGAAGAAKIPPTTSALSLASHGFRGNFFVAFGNGLGQDEGQQLLENTRALPDQEGSPLRRNGFAVDRT